MHTPFATITTEAINESSVRDAVSAPESGAVAIFVGVVRNHDGGHRVNSLEYEAHPEAENMLAECCRSVAEETGLMVAAAHRVGHLTIGDVALYAAASAAHRKEAFAACELLVERIKATVPIWKRQFLADGATEWVGL
ncbi:molybdenum cofactor biosynthesis protein MoaE [Homoserinimonas sp. A447]